MSNEIADGAFVAAVNKGAEFLDETECLQAEAAALREALLELLGHPSDNPLHATKTEDGYMLTPLQITERKAKAALAADAGREMLERLRRAEAQRDKLEQQLNELTNVSLRIAESKPRY